MKVSLGEMIPSGRSSFSLMKRLTKGVQRQDSTMPRMKDFVARLAAFSSQRHRYNVRNPRQVIPLEGGGEKRQSMIS